jgi:hypothetical protein
MDLRIHDRSNTAIFGGILLQPWAFIDVRIHDCSNTALFGSNTATAIDVYPRLVVCIVMMKTSRWSDCPSKESCLERI